MFIENTYWGFVQEWVWLLINQQIHNISRKEINTSYILNRHTKPEPSGTRK